MSRPGNQLPIIYKEAIRRYEEMTNKKLDEPSILSINTVHQLLAEIDRRNDRFSKFRETRHTFFNVLEGALKPVEIVSNLSSGAASMAFPPSTLVLGAVVYLVNAAKGISASYDAIQSLMGSLKDFTVRLSVYDREQISEELSAQLSEVLITLIEIFALSRKEIKSGRILKYAKNVIGSNDQIQAAVNKLAKLTEMEGRLVGAETWTETKKTGRAVNDVAVTLTATNFTVQETGVAVGQMSLNVTEISEKMENLVHSMNETRKEAKVEQNLIIQNIVKKVLQPSVVAQDWYNKINKSRVPGTGDWIRGESFFQAWIKKVMPVLWVSGNPGAGKSYLSSNIISFLGDRHPQGVQHPSHVSVGYFFFKDDSHKTRSFHQALCDLAYQISQNDPVYAKYVAASCDIAEDVSTLHSAWRVLFVNFFLKKKDVGSSVYLVIDGVDEAFEAEWKIFLDLIKDVNEATSPAHIQLLMVGRPQLSVSISEALEADVPTIYVTSDKNSTDIISYIRNSIHKSNLLKRVSVELRAEIVEKLSTRAQGMFIWVDLVLQELLKKRSESAIRKSLDDVPKGLKAMLRHVLEGFSLSLADEEPENLNELLAWTACAPRPLMLGELDTILKLKSPDGDGMIYLEEALRKQFASFFSLTREDGRSTAELQIVRPTGDETDDEVDNSGPDEGFDDNENPTDFDSNPTTTEVTFCHASIGDFLRDESQGKVSADDDHPAVGVDFNQAKISVLKTCLELFCNDELAKKPQNSTQSMIPYALDNWYYHFCAVKPSTAEPSQRRELGGLLVKMFGREAFMNNWASGVELDLFTDDKVRIVRSWMADENLIQSLSSEDRTFVKSSSELPVLILKPLARYIAHKWLEDEDEDGNWLPAFCCSIVHGYISLERGTPRSLIDLDTAEGVISVAKWPNLIETALWHRRLAIALQVRQEYDVSLQHFTKALELDSAMWLARAGMAAVHVEKGNHEQAIELDKITEHELRLMTAENSPSIKLHLHNIQERMARCYEVLEDEENSLAYYRIAQQNNQGCNQCICDVLDKMHVKCLHKDMIELLKALDGEKVPRQNISRLTEFLSINAGTWYHPRIIALAANETNSLDYLKEAYSQAIHAARRSLTTVVASWLELSLATIYDQYIGEKKEAARIWNKIIETFAESKYQTGMGHVKQQASIFLARYYFDQALNARVGSNDAEKYVKKLEKLAKPRARSVNDSSAFIGASFSAVILGLWYRLNGLNENARACFLPFIQESLQMLSDDDPRNDETAYSHLVNVLMAAGDDKNVIAIHYLFSRYADDKTSKRSLDPLELVENEANAIADREEESGEDSESDSDDDGFISFTCDGSCYREFSNFDNIYLCRYCYDVGFCEDCMKLMKDGKMRLDVCSRLHEWLYIPPRPPISRRDKSQMIVDGTLVDFEDWKNSLRREWRI